MVVHDLLLEIGVEEIPARFMPGGLKQLQEKAAKLFREHRLIYDNILTFGTPRRLILLVKDLAGEQQGKEEKIRGPARQVAFDAEGNPTRAALGFAGKLGLGVEALNIEKTAKGEHLFAVKKIAGKKTAIVLTEVLPALIKSLTFPKNMFWGENKIRFPRPIRWFLCLYGKETIPFVYGGLKAGNQTQGHRFLSPGPLVVTDPAHYFSAVEEAGVLIDPERRRQIISEKVRAAAAKQGLQAQIEPALLAEVTFLVEKPAVLLCSFPEEYLQLPREVLVTTMQNHQRYFPVEDLQGQIGPFFIVVSNNGAAPEKIVRNGNERVLKARLADARFFYTEDLKDSLASKVEKLKRILFHEELGSLYAKTGRLAAVCKFLAERLDLSAADKKAVLRAAYLCKADLATGMVGEFPELQGNMGREYALHAGESEAVATAIGEHYQPRFAGDRLPGTKPGILLALADKADHLAAFFALGIRPTGSQDPYALRRQCLGLLQILWEHDLPLGFGELLGHAFSHLQEKNESLQKLPPEKLLTQTKEFAWQRLRYLFQEKGAEHDLIEAVLQIPSERIALLWQRVEFLQENRQNENLALAAAAYVRVANLARQARPGVELAADLLREKGEKELYRQYSLTQKRVAAGAAVNDWQEMLTALAALKKPLDAFFEKIMVMDKDEKIRNNRLAFLMAIKNLYLQLADLSKITFPA
ncbi:MAG: glycine--tRNA ligase subunit beta [Firmicutes bacterium]|nr:glycine--tRNA ligase subunit beta [Bacillota bacterium]